MGVVHGLRAFVPHLVAGVGATVLCPAFVPTDLARSSAQNRPDDLAADLPDLAAARASTGTVQDVAAAALAAVERGALHVVTGVGAADRARARVERLLADLPAPRTD